MLQRIFSGILIAVALYMLYDTAAAVKLNAGGIYVSLIAGVLLFALVGFIVIRSRPVKGIGTLRPGELAQKMARAKPGEVEWIDVREPGEFAAGHVRGFRNLPLSQLRDRLSELPREKEIVLICRSGSRSMMAARMLKRSGCTRLYNVAGGLSQGLDIMGRESAGAGAQPKGRGGLHGVQRPDEKPHAPD